MNVLLAISAPPAHLRTEDSLSSKDHGAEPRPGPRQAGLGKTLIEGVGNYLIPAGPQVGNSVIVSTSGMIVIATTAGIYYSADSGASWHTAQFTAPQPAGGFTFVGMTTQLQGVAVPADPSLGEIWVTLNGAKGWMPSSING